jgi:hypothetical protein
MIRERVRMLLGQASSSCQKVEAVFKRAPENEELELCHILAVLRADKDFPEHRSTGQLSAGTWLKECLA